MQAMIEQFIDHISLERGMSDHTRDAYRSDLDRFAQFLQSRRIDSLNEVTRRHITDFLLHEKARQLAAATLSRRLVSIKVFMRFLQHEGLLDENMADAMDSPRLWKLLPETLSPAEVDRLLDAPAADTDRGGRDRALLELWYATGLRVSELAALKLTDVHLAERYLRCTGKGNKERVVPFGDKARRILEDYIQAHRPALLRHRECDQVFVTRRGTGFSRKGLWKLVKTHTRGAGLGKRVTPHTLRHSFASHLLSHGAPLRVIQEMLGHADIATTQIYTHVDQQRLKSIHHQYHPRA